MIIKDIEKNDWLARWAGSYTFISCSYWAKQYYISLKKELGVYFKHSLFIHKKGTAVFYIPHNEFEELGKYLARKSERNIEYVKNTCQAVKDNADKLSSIMKKLDSSIPNQKEYSEFLKHFEKHLGLHVFIKKTVDFLKPEHLDKLLPYFKEARLYTENIYSDTESFFRSMAKSIAKKEKYDAEHLTCLTQDDLEEYIKSRKLPSPSILKERYNTSAIYSDNGKVTIFIGEDVKNIEESVVSTENNQEIKGVSAFKGRVEGIARIVLDPHNVKEFNNGEILITGMTRPEFMPLVKKSIAIVTDVGGVLSHAAITAREFKIPTIVGMGSATKIIKDGDKIIVNANKGVVKILK